MFDDSITNTLGHTCPAGDGDAMGFALPGDDIDEVVVREQDTEAGVVDKLTEQETAVPFLSNIPLLGALFRSTSVRKEKSNLMIFIRPVILRGSEEADYYTRRKYDSLRNAQLEDGGAVPLIGGPRPLVQNFEEYAKQRPVAAPLAEPDIVPPSEQEPTPPSVEDGAAKTESVPPAEDPAPQ